MQGGDGGGGQDGAAQHHQQDQVTSGTLQRYCELDNVIRDMGDIERLKTRGFRREALSSLCQVAYLTIVFRTEAELAATKTSCAGMPGSTVTADNLFCRLPVRRNYYKSANRRKEELDKVKMLVQARRFARKRDRVLSPDRGGLAHLAADHHCPGPAPLSGQGQGRVPDVCCLRGLEQ